MYCPKCGAYNDNENIWCVHCGHGKLPSINATMEETITEKDGEAPLTEGVKSTYNDVLTTDDNIKIETKKAVENVCIETPGCQWQVQKKDVKDYLVMSIISAVFGSVIFGVIAIIFSALTKSENEVSNYVKAKEYSSKAKLFSIIALIVGISKYIFAIALVAMFISGSFFYLF